MRATTLPFELSAPGGPLDTFNSMPAHPLVVHAPVVLIPLCAIGLVVVAIVPRWRRKYGWLLLIGMAVASVSAFLAKESGEALAARVGQPERHAELGSILPWISLAMVVLTGIWLIICWRNARGGKGAGAEGSSDYGDGSASATRGSGPFQWLFGILAVVAAVLATVWVFLVGDSGAKAVWGKPQPAAASSAAPASSAPAAASPAASATPEPGDTAAPITMVELAEHSSPKDCWAAVRGTVYNLTAWEAQSASGVQAIDPLCGTDATAEFESQNAGATEPEDVLAGLQVGVLVP